MAHLIDKDALVAEIERRIKSIENLQEKSVGDSWSLTLERYTYLEVKHIIDTLEVKDVDLEKHLKEDIEDVFFDLNGVVLSKE